MLGYLSVHERTEFVSRERATKVRYQEFIDRVNEITKHAVPADPERATSATLQTLRKRITSLAAGNLASQLPAGIKEHLSDGQGKEAQSFSLPQFYERVADREGKNPRF